MKEGYFTEQAQMPSSSLNLIWAVYYALAL